MENNQTINRNTISNKHDPNLLSFKKTAHIKNEISTFNTLLHNNTSQSGNVNNSISITNRNFNNSNFNPNIKSNAPGRTTFNL